MLSTVALAALLGNSSAADYYINADPQGGDPTPQYSSLEDLRSQASPFTVTTLIDFTTLGVNDMSKPILFDASLQAPLISDFPDSFTDPATPTLFGLTSNITELISGGPAYFYPAITISPAEGFEANSSFYQALSGTGHNQYPAIYAAPERTFIFEGFTNSALNFSTGSTFRAFVGYESSVHLGTLIFQNNIKLTPDNGGAAIRSSAIFTLQCGTYEFRNNIATMGGAVFVDNFAIRAGIVTFDNNWAVAGDSLDSRAGRGGAVYTHGFDLNAFGEGGRNALTENWIFTNNLASALGGAVYEQNGNLSIIAHNAFNTTRPGRGQLIEFKGNRDGVTFTPDGLGGFIPDRTSGKANAIQFNTTSQNFMTINAHQGNDNINFYDPIMTAQEKNSGVSTSFSFTNFNYDPNSGSKFRGVLTFDGSYWSTLPGHSVTEADLTSIVYGNTTLGAGWMKIINGAVFNVEQAGKTVESVHEFFGGDFQAGGKFNKDASNDLGPGGAVFVGPGSSFNVAGNFTAAALNNADGGALWLAVDDTDAGHISVGGNVSFWDNMIYLDLSAVSDSNTFGEWDLFDLSSDLSSSIIIRVTFQGVDWARYATLGQHWDPFNPVTVLRLEDLANGFIWNAGAGAWLCNQTDLDRTWILTPDGTLSLVPEPTTWALLGLSGLAVVLFRRKKS